MPLQKNIGILSEQKQPLISALREYRHLKDLRNGLISRDWFEEDDHVKFKETGYLGVLCSEEDGYRLELKLSKKSLLLWLK
ncbi:hypothetical protein TNCV_2804221 [Trichonephila clavipes]|nr:hypothetical protein TNCV_2804221 [Trichonephila clavipes]